MENKIHYDNTQLKSMCIPVINNLVQNEDIKIKVSGDNVPEPVLRFEDLSFNRSILNNIIYNHYIKPTNVQKYAIPIIANNRDLIACAQTGSGKTAAFLLPLLNHISFNCKRYRESNFKSEIYPFALILTPTRELALQIYKEARNFSHKTYLQTHVVYGGVDIKKQILNLNGDCDILIATPGRLIDLCNRGNINFNLTRFVVLDEADRMLDMGFEPQIRSIFENKDMPTTTKRQTIMFSATFPQEIQKLAKEFLRKDYIFLSVGRVGSTTSNIKQYIELVEENEKLLFLLDLLSMNSNASTLVFVETKARATELEHYLVKENYAAISIHGNKSQYEREKALSQFRNLKKNILIATAVAARGLDIPNIQYVINMDMPSDIEEYIHRIGRTGRGENTGIAISFYNDMNSNIAVNLVKILNETQQVIPNFLLNKTIEIKRTQNEKLYKYTMNQLRRDFNQDHRSKLSKNYEKNHSGEFKKFEKCYAENKKIINESNSFDWFDTE